MRLSNSRCCPHREDRGAARHTRRGMRARQSSAPCARATVDAVSRDYVDLKPTQALKVAKRQILLATVFFGAAHAKGALAIDVATCRAGLVGM